MAKNSGGLIRQLLGNRNHPCAAGILHHLHHKPIQNLTSVSNTAPSSPQTIDIRSASKPLSYYSLRTPNLQFLQQRRCLSSLSDSDSNVLLSGPSNLYVIETLDLYYEVLEKVEALKWITPIFDELCEQFQHITMYKVYMDKNSPGCPLDIFGVHHNVNGTRVSSDMFEDNHKATVAGSTLDMLGIHRTPTFHCYLKGERVDELVGASTRHLKKRLENVYDPSRMKERRRRGKKVENDGGLVEVLPIEFPKTSMLRVMVDQVDKFLDEIPNSSKVGPFAKGMFSCQEQREMLCKLEDPKARLEWFKSEMGGE